MVTWISPKFLCSTYLSYVEGVMSVIPRRIDLFEGSCDGEEIVTLVERSSRYDRPAQCLLYCILSRSN